MIKRKTLQNALVLETVEKLKNHPTADEVYSEITKSFPSVSRATVYRNLQNLCETGKLKKREVPGASDRYDHCTSDHYHVRCSVCGKFIDVKMDYMYDLPERVSDSKGFEITGHSIVFEGICPDCLSKRK